MNQVDYAKVLLYAYPKLDMLREAVESGARIKALLSFRSRGGALAVTERIVCEIVTAKKLALLKGELDEVLSVCSERELFLLEYKYFRRKELLRGKFSGFRLECSERSYFRMQNALLSKLATRLVAVGWTEKRFFAEFGDFKPFMRVFRAIREGRERAVVFKRRKRQLMLRQNSGNSCGDGADFLPRKTITAIAATATAATQTIAICTPESPGCFALSPSPVIPPEEG